MAVTPSTGQPSGREQTGDVGTGPVPLPVGEVTFLDPDAVAPALLAALGASEDGTRPAAEVALDHLRCAEPALVVFDNCEHLTAAVAGLVDRYRAACPTLTLLVTSREPLGLAGEGTWRGPPAAL